MRVKHVVPVTLALVVLMGVVAPPVRADVSFEGFYQSLSPHGSWLVSAQLGRVWQPRECGRGWNPYYDGRWEYADVGWTWVSDYSWGAIPYHYGTWTVDPRFGWVWVPGYTWAPAWVSFRTGPDYIGWAPVAPSFSVGVSFASYAPPTDAFVFVPTRDFTARTIRTRVIGESQARLIVNETRPVDNLVLQHNIIVNRGPDVRVVEAATRHKISVTAVESLPRVAPFSNVRRTQLAISPERTRHAVRAAEPMRALPASSHPSRGTSKADTGKSVKHPKQQLKKKTSGDHGQPKKERRAS
jgi:hypothetical protein